MKKITIFLLIALFMSSLLQAQVKIGDNPQNIDASSILELESNSRVLVITRINTAEMNAIVPNQGALVYNTDTQCIHYYNGTTWANLCESAGGTGNFTTDAIVNNLETIVITPTADGQNVEVALNSITQENMTDDSIGTDQIQSRSIEDRHIKDNSIGPNKLADDSVDRTNIRDGAVGNDAIDFSEVDLSSFTNITGFITSADIVSIDAGNAIENRPNGAFFDQQPLLDAIDINSIAITDHIAADNDISATNEIQNLETATLSATNILTIDIENGDPVTVDLSSLSGTGTDEQNLETATLSATNILTIDIENGDPVTVDLNSLSGTGTDNQQLTLETGNLLTLEGNATPIDLTPFLDNQTITDFTFDDATNLLTLTIDGGNTVDANLSSLAGGGSQNLAQVLAEGTDGGEALIKNILDPVDPQDAATRAYVDATVAATGTLTDGTILIGSAGDTAQQLAISGDATLANDGVLTIANDAVTIDKIGTDAATDINKVLGTDATGNPEWQDPTVLTANIGEDVISTNGTITGIQTDAALVAMDLEVKTDDITLEVNSDNTTGLQIKDDGVTIDKIGTDPTTDTNKVLGTDAAGDPEWQDPISVSGNQRAVFYAGPDGLPTTADDNANTNDDGNFYWDVAGRDVGGGEARFQFGALYVGLSGTNTNIQSNNAKVQIADSPGNAIGYALQVQNYSGSPTGILFSTATNNNDNYGKGSLVYENDNTIGDGFGDFHFLQNETQDTNNNQVSIPTIADKAFSIRNNKDIVIYGGIEIEGIGTGTAGQVLTSTGAGRVQWSTPATAKVTSDIGSVFFADGTDGITENNNQLFWDDSDNRLNLGGGFVDREQKLNVRGGIRASEYVAAASTVQPSYRFDNDPDTGLKHTGANEVALVAGGEEMISLDFSVGNGNVIVANGSLELKEELIDLDGSAGNVGQVLNSTNTGVVWSEPVIFSMGKINPGGADNINGANLTGSAGNYTITFPNQRPDTDYIIQLTVMGNNRIFVTNQTDTLFEVSILDENGNPPVSPLPIWYYTVSDF